MFRAAAVAAISIIFWGIVSIAVDGFVTIAAIPKPAKWQHTFCLESVRELYFAVVKEPLKASACHHQIFNWHREQTQTFCSRTNRNCRTIPAGRLARVGKVTGQHGPWLYQRVSTTGMNLISWCHPKIFNCDEISRLRETIFGGDKLSVFLGAVSAINASLGDNEVGSQLSSLGVAGNSGLIASQPSVNAEDYDAYDRSYKRHIFEAIVTFLLGCLIAVSGVCCAFYVWGGHPIRALIIGAAMILMGATVTGLVGLSVGTLNFF